MLSFALNRYFLGHDVWYYKLVNVVIHGLVGVALYGFLASLFKTRWISPSLTNGLRRWLPVLVVAWWMLHPIQLTTVLYVSQRMASLAALFIVLGAWAYLAGRARQQAGDRLGWILIGIAAGVCGPLALLSKQNGVLLYPIMALIEIMCFGFRSRKGRLDKALLSLQGLTVGIPLALVLLVLIVRPESLLGAYDFRPFDLTERLLTQARAIILYVTNILVPRTETLALWHDDFAVSTSLLDPPQTLSSIIGVLGMVTAAFLLWSRSPLVVFGILWFFIGHSLESSIFPLEMVHEHRNYLASLGIGLVLVGIVLHLKTFRVELKLGLLLVPIVFSALTLAERARDWRSPYQLAYSSYENKPDSPMSNIELAKFLKASVLHGNKNPEEIEELADTAEKLFYRAVELESYHVGPEMALIIFQYLHRKDYDRRLIQKAIDKLHSYPGIPASSAALRGLRRCIDDKNCVVDMQDQRRLFGSVANSRFPEEATEAALFYKRSGEHGLAVEVTTRLATEFSDNLTIRKNHVWSLLLDGRLREGELELQRMKKDENLDLRYAMEDIDRLERAISGLKDGSLEISY